MTTSIFNMPSPASSSPSPKIHFIHSTISPKYLDPSQPPTKTSPFQQIDNVPFAKDLRICMPIQLYESLYPSPRPATNNDTDHTNHSHSFPLPTLKYSKITTSLTSLLDNETFRRGNYLFLSNDSDNDNTTISLSRGTLTLTMPAHIYQRSGLTFRTTKLQTGSRKHDARAMRYRVEIDLREPSMVRGKKGFDRVMYAARNVEGIKGEREWVVYEFGEGRMKAKTESESGGGKKRKRGEDTEVSMSTEDTRHSGADEGEVDGEEDPSKVVGGIYGHPLSKFTLKTTTTQGVLSTFEDVLIPAFLRDPTFFSTIQPKAINQTSQKANLPTILEEDIYDIIEYLSLLFHQSPRIVKSQYGKIDPYLCQYTLPDVSSTSATSISDTEVEPEITKSTGISEDLILISYSGFIPSEFVTQVLVDLLRKSRSARISNTELYPWVVINLVAQPTETTGTSDGLMVVLQGDSTTSIKADLGVDGEGSDKMDVSAGEQTRQLDSAYPGGLHYATCFEFVDSITG